MKRLKEQIALWAAVWIGGVSAMLRKRLYWSVDERLLLVPGQPEQIALLVITAGMVLFLLLQVYRQKGTGKFGDNFTCPGPEAIGHFLLAAGILATAVTRAPKMGGVLGLLWQLLGYLTPVCLTAAGIARLRKQRPHFLLHMVVCLYFVFHVVNQFRAWSGTPQMMDYLFALFGSIGLILFAYYQTAFDIDTGKRRPMLYWGYLGIFLCLVELARSEFPLVYMGGVFWLTGCLASMTHGAALEAEGGRHDPA